MTEKTVAAVPETKIAATREEERFLTPPVDIYETEERLIAICDMPGVQAEDVDVKVEDGILSIQGRVPPANKETATYSEFELHSFFRQFELSQQIDQDGISAELKNGVLTVHLPKIEKPKPKQISIKIA